MTQATVNGKFITIAKARAKNKSSLRTLPLVAPFKKLLLRIKEEQAEQRIYTHMDFNKMISSANAITGLLGKEKEPTSASG